MLYKEVFEKFCIENTIVVLVKTKVGLRALSEHNFAGGTCGCCKGCSDDDDLEVVRVVDVETMETFYEHKRDE